jgi:carbon monoxide dehydrogenase subunit G
MRFDDSFTVPVSPPKTWEALTNIELVYPCLPGAELTEVRDNEFHGLVTLKLGPITATYKGVARFESLDEEGRTLVIQAQGRDKHGQGTAKARVHASLVPEGDDATRVEMTNEVDITGKAAQFGRGIITDVSKEIMGQFADNLRDVVSGPSQPSEGAAPAGAAGPPPAEGAGSPAAIGVGTLAARVAGKRIREHPVATAAVGMGALLLAWTLARLVK